ncbi:MAG TPA: hypothetical protein VKG25_20730 [Bryobacteraceae bacterium]|nr:hypothetical protein [Bryobacteraceae bacterium]
MHLRLALALAAAVAFSPVAFSQGGLLGLTSDVFQVNYSSNLDRGDSYVDMTNSGAHTQAVGLVTGSSDPATNICANLYTFDAAAELISCCTCLVTPGGLQSLSVINSLISNPLTPAIPSAVIVKAVANLTSPCDASAVTPDSLVHGLLVWNTTLHQNTSTATPSYSLTETAFSFAALSAAELTHLTSTCGFIQANGSGFGICKGCNAGGLGASTSGH